MNVQNQIHHGKHGKHGKKTKAKQGNADQDFSGKLTGNPPLFSFFRVFRVFRGEMICFGANDTFGSYALFFGQNAEKDSRKHFLR
ncbi:MAG: hypothetical protein ACYC3I_15580 [Gemmataceae bacterium]